MILANTSLVSGYGREDTEPTCLDTLDIWAWDLRGMVEADTTGLRISHGKKVFSLGLAKPLFITCKLIDFALIVPEIEKPRLGGENGDRFFLNHTPKNQEFQ